MRGSRLCSGLWVLALSVALGATLLAATGDTRQPGPIQVYVDEVVVPVVVTDEKGRFVTDLRKEDFRIFDQGVEQQIEYFSAERTEPVVIGFLIEQSNTMRLHWKQFQETAIELVLALMSEQTGFYGYLISYSTTPELLVNTTQDPSEIVEKIRSLKPGGGSALFDAIYLACTKRQLIEGEPINPRRVLIIIGDGHDNASEHTLEQVIELAQRNLVTIYGVSTVAFEAHQEEERNLLRLAQETGGRVEYPLNDVYKDVAGYLSKPSDAGNYALTVGTGGYAAHLAQRMFESITAILGDLTTQYILRYRPTVTDDPRIFRQIRVEVNIPGVKVRHRRGYYPYVR